MTSLLNRIILFLLIISIMLLSISLPNAILPIIIAIAFSGFMEYFSSIRLSIGLFIIYLMLCIVSPNFIYFLPIIFYDLLVTKYQYLISLSLIAVIKNLNIFPTNIFCILVIITIIEIVLKYIALKTGERHYKYIVQRDTLTEKSINLENRIRELTDKQDEEINLAMLNERNRIAREIHDNVGHLLSSSIIQVGAIMATTKDENTKNGLETVKKTLDDGMNSIRNSVHNLRDNSIDLYMQLKKITESFTFCNAVLNFEANSTFNIKAKYAIISIVNEALNNVMKHSNASEVIVSVYEHPKIIQLIILDNGTKMKTVNDTGMGLESIKQRVHNLNGYLNIDNTNGYKIFISFNKEEIV